MRTYLHLLTAACLGTSALLLAVPVVGAADMPGQNNTMMENNVVLPAGIMAKDLNSDKSIEKSFKGITDDAMSKSGFDNLVGYLVTQDKERIKKSTDKSLTNLDGNNNKQLHDVIVSLDTAWKNKYNQKFDMDYSKVFTSDFIHIATGEVDDPALLVGHWPVQATRLVPTAGTLTPTEADISKAKTFGGDVKLEKGREVAIAHLVASHGMPGLTASLIHEHLSGWHFDIPNNIDAQMLYNNLISNLSYLDSHHDTLPADVNDGYREVSHVVIAALYGVDLQKLPPKTASER